MLRWRESPNRMSPLPLLVLFLALLGAQEPSNPPAPSNGELREGAQDNGEGNQDQRAPEERSPLPVTESELRPPSPRPFGAITLGVQTGDTKHDEREQKDEKTSGSDQSVFTFLTMFEKSFWGRVSESILEIEPFLMLIFTAVLVTLAILQSRLNKRFFYLAHRPRLEIRDIKYPDVPKLPKSTTPFNLAVNELEAEGTHGYIDVVNAGGSVAKPFQEYVAIQMARGMEEDWVRPWRDVQCDVGIGKQHRIVYEKQEWSDEEIYHLSDRSEIYFRGGVRYKDRLGFERMTEFRHEYMPGTGFVHMANSPYNTQD